jgi:hypothetical protein
VKCSDSLARFRKKMVVHQLHDVERPDGSNPQQIRAGFAFVFLPAADNEPLSVG